MRKTVAVGISGGVDSSIAAYLLKKQGFNVIGLWMDILGKPDNAEDARKVAEFLSIPFYSIDVHQKYTDSVISYIQRVYSRGQTPNPCIMCNRKIKFGALLETARSSGIDFDFFATGHYACIEKNNQTGRYHLKKSVSDDKDQVYFLSMLKQSQLANLIFPLCGMEKSSVKKLAADMGLFTADKRESQDLCTGDYREFIETPSHGGAFIDTEGRVLGRHKGIELYTRGQRRGLGISSSGPPYYVVGIDPVRNTVTLGYDDDLMSRECTVSQVNWISWNHPVLPLKVLCKIRYRDTGAPAVITEGREEGTYTVRFDYSRRAITPGQTAVFYRNTEVCGAGIIEDHPAVR